CKAAIILPIQWLSAPVNNVSYQAPLPPFSFSIGGDNYPDRGGLRDSTGRSVKDPLTGERRRIDFVVKGQDGQWRPVEITSRTAPKDVQLAKEDRIRQIGGVFVKNRNTGELIQLDELSIIIRAK
ncbi:MULTISPECIES: hypothetical protein, partial [unclassified Brenneria]|uniref:hypothetical protein n=1 Tax=unclassified Brenneria TaxID=2634434 RepID=UPI0029C14A95